MLTGQLIDYIPGEYYKIPIQGLNYEINHLGEIRHIKSKRPLKTYLNGGYVMVCSSYTPPEVGKSIDKMWGVHRLVLITFKPIDNPDDYDGHHDDRNRENNCITNLFWKIKSEHSLFHSKNKVGILYEYENLYTIIPKMRNPV